MHALFDMTDSRRTSSSTSLVHEQDDETAAIWQKLRKRIHSSMIAFGSEAITLPTLITEFRNDWCEELEWYARKLGYVYQKPEAAILQMLRKMPEELVCGFQPQENGGIAFRLKVTPKECTRSVLAVIDATNQRQEEQRKQKIERRRSADLSRVSHFSSSSSSVFHPSHPNLMPLGSVRRNPSLVVNEDQQQHFSSSSGSSYSTRSRPLMPIKPQTRQSQEDLQQWQNGANIEDDRIKSPPSASAQERSPSTLLFVSGIEDSQANLKLLTYQEIMEIFLSKVPSLTVLDVKLFVKRGPSQNPFALVEVKNLEEAERAVTILNGIELPSKHKLQVGYSQYGRSLVPANRTIHQHRETKRSFFRNLLPSIDPVGPSLVINEDQQRHFSSSSDAGLSPSPLTPPLVVSDIHSETGKEDTENGVKEDRCAKPERQDNGETEKEDKENVVEEERCATPEQQDNGETGKENTENVVEEERCAKPKQQNSGYRESPHRRGSETSNKDDFSSTFLPPIQAKTRPKFNIPSEINGKSEVHNGGGGEADHRVKDLIILFAKLKIY